MINDYWTVSVFGISYGFRIVKAFRTFIGNGMMNDYRIVCVLGQQVIFRCNMAIG